MNAKKRTEQLARLAPRLTDRELREINGLFRAYIFRRSRTGEVWTSCCGVHKIIQRCENDDQWRVMNQAHTPAPVYRGGASTRWTAGRGQPAPGAGPRLP